MAKTASACQAVTTPREHVALVLAPKSWPASHHHRDACALGKLALSFVQPPKWLQGQVQQALLLLTLQL